MESEHLKRSVAEMMWRCSRNDSLTSKRFHKPEAASIELQVMLPSMSLCSLERLARGLLVVRLLRFVTVLICVQGLRVQGHGAYTSPVRCLSISPDVNGYASSKHVVGESLRDGYDVVVYRYPGVQYCRHRPAVVLTSLQIRS